ncbi:MAG TPA: hypothetical protein VH374_19190 [Polyangia bacterium]|jgi:hypothetical protein|nr:hypothetical protein [Polyangia bacterium]
MRTEFHSFWWAAGVVWLVGACVAQSESGNPGSDAATIVGAGSGGSSGGAAGSGGAGAGAPASGGAPGAVDAAIEMTTVSEGGSLDQAAGDGAPIALAGCAQNNYPVCMDFETLPDAKWTGIGANVQTVTAAHGKAAFHGPPASSITTKMLGPITNVVWGRFYLHMTPKAPVGHGAMVMLFDQPGSSGNWYEVGYEYNALQGNWHGNGGEKYMRTKMVLPDKWVCVEFFADGANAAPIKLWMDGVLVGYYDVAASPTVGKTVKFSQFSIGFTPYHGLSTVSYEGNTMPMTDMWIDDIALDVQRIGCIAN